MSLDNYVVLSICIILFYTVASLIVTAVTGVNLDTLTTCIFSTFGGELLACAVIKVFKLKK